MTKYLYMINQALTCIDKLLKVISERNYLQNYVSRMFYNSCNISILYQTLHRLKVAFFFFFIAFITQKLLHQKSYMPKFLQYWALQYNSIIFLLISFSLSLSCVSLLPQSLLSSLSLLFCHTISPKFLPLSLSFFPLFSLVHSPSSHRWIMVVVDRGSWLRFAPI